MSKPKTLLAVVPSEFVGKHVVHRKTSQRSYQNGKWEYETEERDVILMALSGKWAMVRRPKCMPYTVYVKELVLPTT